MLRVIPLDKPDATPISMPDRFRLEVVYFMSPVSTLSGEPISGAPACGDREYWIRTEDTKRWLDEGVFTLVSPLDAESVAEIELSEDQERWLEWMDEHCITHIRIES